jgi:DNA-binding CsgD family transcriptional regulator
MRIEDSDILMDLYRGADPSAPWHSLFLRLNERAQATQSAIWILPPDADPATGFHLAAYPQMSAPAFAPDVLQRLRFQRVYSAQEIVVAPDVPYARIVRTRIDGGGDAYIFVARGGTDFPAAITALISGLGPHLAVAAASYLHQCRQKDALAISRTIQTQLRMAWMTLAPTGFILQKSENWAMLEPVFGPIGSRLLLSGTHAKHLAQALIAYETQQHQRPIALSLDAGAMLIKPYQGHDRRAVATAFLRLRGHSELTAFEILAQIAHITPSEARFALKLADGHSIAQAATALGLTLETARNYSKKIYSKMDLRGQSDLIRFIENSIIRLI